MFVEARKMEYRGSERRVSKTTNQEYLVVHVEDESGSSYRLLDRNLEHFTQLKKGSLYDLTLNLRLGRYMNVSIARISPHKG